MVLSTAKVPVPLAVKDPVVLTAAFNVANPALAKVRLPVPPIPSNSSVREANVLVPVPNVMAPV